MYNWSPSVTNCVNCTFSKNFTSVFRKIHCVLLTVIRLYWVASQCRQLYVPKQKLERNKQGFSQLMQTAPLMDDCIPGPQTRPTLMYTEPSPSPLLTPLTPQTLAFQQDSVTEEHTPELIPQPPQNTSSDSETPVRQVSPLLGTTPRENL